MIQRFEVSGVHVEVTKELKAYVHKKIGKLEDYIPRYARKVARIEVKLKDEKKKSAQQFACEIVMHLPKENLATSAAGASLEAAIDEAEDTLRLQLKKYKEKHAQSRHRVLVRSVLGRIRPRS